MQMNKEKSVQQDKKIQKLMQKKKDEIDALKKLLASFEKDKNKKSTKV
jgi:hypothetical protein